MMRPPELKPLLHTWSLGCEEQYYFIFPLLMLLCRRLRKAWLFCILCTVAGASLFYSHWGTMHKPEAAYFLLPYRFWELLIGALLAIYIAFRPGGKDAEKSSSRANELMGLAGLSLIFFSIFFFDEETAFPGFNALVPTLGAMLIIAFANRHTKVGRLLGSRVLVGIGLVSYSTYLWHQPLFAFARHRNAGTPEMFIMALLSLTAILLGYLSWRYVERPFRTRDVIGSKALWISCFAGTAFFLMVGLAGKPKDGLLSRLGQPENVISREFHLVTDERRALMREDECWFHARGSQPIDQFIKQWDCRTDPKLPSLVSLPMIVAGDSHSADKVIALKLNGFIPLQIGGAGCSINPRLMKHSCPQIFQHLQAEIKGDIYYEYIVLANRLDRSELSIESIKEAIDYWEGFGRKIIFFTGMPRFPGLQYRAAKNLPINADFELSDFSERKELMEYLESRGVHVVNTRKIFCSITSDCDYRDVNGALLLMDVDHLSPHGAARFGEQLIKTDRLFQMISERCLSEVLARHPLTSLGRTQHGILLMQV